MWNLLSTQRGAGSDNLPAPLPSSPSKPDVVASIGIETPRSAASGAALVSVDSELAGVVADVEVVPGDRVEEGAILFRLDDRAKQSELKLKRAARQVVKQQLAKLQAPRTEECLLAQTKVDATEATKRAAQDALQRATRLRKQTPGAITAGEMIKLEEAWKVASANFEGAKAQLAFLEAGTPAADLAVAQAKLDEAEAAVEQVAQDLERLIVRARQAGTVLEVNVRPGEAVSAQPGQRLVVLGGPTAS
jgi:HlyD family secretion protein